MRGNKSGYREWVEMSREFSAGKVLSFSLWRRPQCAAFFSERFAMAFNRVPECPVVVLLVSLARYSFPVLDEGRRIPLVVIAHVAAATINHNVVIRGVVVGEGRRSCLPDENSVLRTHFHDELLDWLCA